jgi:hypothetical protein
VATVPAPCRQAGNGHRANDDVCVTSLHCILF